MEATRTLSLDPPIRRGAAGIGGSRLRRRRARHGVAVLACGAVVLLAAVCAPVASAATLAGFGAAPSSGDGPARSGDLIDYTIRTTGDSPSSFVVSVNGDQVAKGDAFPGVMSGQFVLPDVKTSANSVTVGVSVDDPDSEPRTVAVPFAAGGGAGGDDQSAAEQQGGDQPAAASSPPEATPEPAAEPQPDPAPATVPETAAGGDAAAVPAATPAAPAAAAPKAAAPAGRPPAQRRPAQRSAPAAPRTRPAAPAPAAQARKRRTAAALRGRVGGGVLSGLPVAAGSSRGRATPVQSAPAPRDAGTRLHTAPPRGVGPAATPAAGEPAGGGAAAKDDGGGGAMVLLIVLAVLAASVAGAAALRLRTRSKQRYDEFLGPVAMPQRPSAPRRSEPLNLTGAGARERDE